MHTFSHGMLQGKLDEVNEKSCYYTNYAKKLDKDRLDKVLRAISECESGRLVQIRNWMYR